jgi:alpha-tubulin suppressor-like RCC1 family protein
VASLALGADHACALQAAASITDGSGIWCWGSNVQGQLGDGTTERHTTPVRVAW